MKKVLLICALPVLAAAAAETIYLEQNFDVPPIGKLATSGGDAATVQGAWVHTNKWSNPTEGLLVTPDHAKSGNALKITRIPDSSNVAIYRDKPVPTGAETKVELTMNFDENGAQALFLLAAPNADPSYAAVAVSCGAKEPIRLWDGEKWIEMPHTLGAGTFDCTIEVKPVKGFYRVSFVGTDGTKYVSLPMELAHDTPFSSVLLVTSLPEGTAATIDDLKVTVITEDGQRP